MGKCPPKTYLTVNGKLNTLKGNDRMLYWFDVWVFRYPNEFPNLKLQNVAHVTCQKVKKEGNELWY